MHGTSLLRLLLQSILYLGWVALVVVLSWQVVSVSMSQSPRAPRRLVVWE